MKAQRLTSGGLRRRTARFKLHARIKAQSAVATMRSDLAGRSARMHDDAAARSGSRKRGLIAVAAGFAALAGMFELVSANVLAVNFTTMNNQFALYSNYLDAAQAAGYLNPSNKQNGSNVGVAELGIKTAALAGLCGIATETIPIINLQYSLVIKAGMPVATTFSGTGIPTPPGGSLNTAGGSATLSINNTDGVKNDGTINQTNSTAGGVITANQLYINATSLTGYGNKISGLNLGQSADTVDASTGGGLFTTTGASPTELNGPTAGNFGLYAKQLNVAGLSGSAYGLNLAGQITLPQLNISVVPGSQTQTNC